jgi:hypothetical protein
MMVSVPSPRPVVPTYKHIFSGRLSSNVVLLIDVLAFLEKTFVAMKSFD